MKLPTLSTSLSSILLSDRVIQLPLREFAHGIVAQGAHVHDMVWHLVSIPDSLRCLSIIPGSRQRAHGAFRAMCMSMSFAHLSDGPVGGMPLVSPQEHIWCLGSSKFFHFDPLIHLDLQYGVPLGCPLWDPQRMAWLSIPTLQSGWRT